MDEIRIFFNSLYTPRSHSYRNTWALFFLHLFTRLYFTFTLRWTDQETLWERTILNVEILLWYFIGRHFEFIFGHLSTHAYPTLRHSLHESMTGIFVPTSSGWSARVINKTTQHMCMAYQKWLVTSDYIDSCGTAYYHDCCCSAAAKWHKLKSIPLHVWPMIASQSIWILNLIKFNSIWMVNVWIYAHFGT